MSNLLAPDFTAAEFLALIPDGETPASIAYKFAAANNAVSTIMVTRSNIALLLENISTIKSQPLPEEVFSIFRELSEKIEVPVGT